MLSQFPQFEGFSGIIPKRNFSLSNDSGTLGSYGLLSENDFHFVSAPWLATMFSSKSSIEISKFREIAMQNSSFESRIFQSGLYMPYPYDLIHNLRRGGWYGIYRNTFADLHFVMDCSDFARKYLTFNIGEASFSSDYPFNREAHALHSGIISELRSRAALAPEHERASMNTFLTGYDRYSYANEKRPPPNEEPGPTSSNGGSIGIIHTSISLEE